MEIQVMPNGKMGLVNLPVYFDFKDKNELIEVIPKWIKGYGLTLIVFNFTTTEFIGSSGVYPFFQFLAGSELKHGRKKVRIAIIGLCDPYQSLMDGMGIRKHFLLYKNGMNFAQEAQRKLDVSPTEAQTLLEWM